jgi:hypothetical protein
MASDRVRVAVDDLLDQMVGRINTVRRVRAVEGSRFALEPARVVRLPAAAPIHANNPNRLHRQPRKLSTGGKLDAPAI